MASRAHFRRVVVYKTVGRNLGVPSWLQEVELWKLSGTGNSHDPRIQWKVMTIRFFVQVGVSQLTRVYRLCPLRIEASRHLFSRSG